jgi:hypothetical protein
LMIRCRSKTLNPISFPPKTSMAPRQGDHRAGVRRIGWGLKSLKRCE